ncbi:hypothetical protein ACMDCR_21495 [Labrys okinawensis]|uniref:hypothetical protein n=1 Tax=Labrys okinawensis TaxID=346911 RepID=UPI0039BC76B0
MPSMLLGPMFSAVPGNILPGPSTPYCDFTKNAIDLGIMQPKVEILSAVEAVIPRSGPRWIPPSSPR